VLVAALTLSAVSASAALAAPEWYAETGGSFGKVTSPVTIHGTTANLTVTDPGAYVAVACEGTVASTIEASGKGKITSYSMANCHATEGECPDMTAFAENLPWKTELYETAGSVRERIVSGGSGTPAWTFDCDGKHIYTCDLNTSAKMVNTLGGAQAVFNTLSNKTTCTDSPEGGEWKGSITSTASEKGVEAIEVEPLPSPGWDLSGVPLSKSVATTVKGKVTLTAEEGGPLTIECEDTGAGSVGPGGVDEVTSMTLSHCVTTAGKCENPTMTALELPWHLELTVTEGVLVLATAGKDRLGYAPECQGVLKGECTGSAQSTSMEMVEGLVEAAYPGQKLSKCSFYPSSFAGNQFIEATKGKLEVTQ
jgi:hypothetical protein